MLYLGALAIITAAYLVWREYNAYLGARLAVCHALRLAVCDLGEKMRCYLSSPREWAEEYSDELISVFLDGLRRGDDVMESYERLRATVRPTADTDGTVRACLMHLGEGSIETELESISLAAEKLEREESRLTEELPKKRRATGAILGASALGIVLFIM